MKLVIGYGNNIKVAMTIMRGDKCGDTMLAREEWV